MGPMDFTGDYLALRRDIGVVAVARDVVAASGPDAATFLQGQLSQDVAGLTEGASAWSLLLQPQGKIDAWLRVVRRGSDEFLLDVDAGYGEAMITRLNRFKLRTKCDLVLQNDWRCLAVRGPHATSDRAPVLAAATGAAIWADAAWPGLNGFDLFGPDLQLPADLPECGLDAYETIRVECGVPAMGRELDDHTIPAEAPIVDRSVSFTKGCYTGQELVARIDSRGNMVPKRLVGVVLSCEVLPPVGAALAVDGTDVGRVTSVARSLDPRAPIALAYLRRAVETPGDVLVTWEGGQAPARVEELPLHRV